MIRKMLAVAALTLTCLIAGGTAAFAESDYSEICMDPASSTTGGITTLAAGTSLPNTGAGIQIGTWVIIGVAILAVGLTLAMIGTKPKAISNSISA